MPVRNVPAWRAALAFAACMSITPLMGGAAQAQSYGGHAPWCANLGHLGTGLECHYYSLQQCMARASGLTDSCSANPWYVPERTRPRRQHRDRPRYQ
jgi:hypothetical protein